MLDWISNAAGNIGSWLGSGIGSFFNWILGGLNIVLTKVIDAARTFWELLDSIWNFGVGLIDSLLELFSAFFPFVPPEVSSVISLAFIAVLVAGIYKKVSGK